MIKKKDTRKGQTALILILLAAAALIFYAITLNWGHLAQSKALLTIAADQSAMLLASDAASYGEMQKQTYLNDTNRVSYVDWMLILAVIVIIIAIIITICSWGAAAPLCAAVITATVMEVIMVIAIVMAVINLILQLAVVTPMMMAMWNKMQQNQPETQQFYEQGVGAALMASVTDQSQITDYFDLNTNGQYGMNPYGSTPKDTISRFGFFYTDRLKMLNQGIIPQVQFFYNQLMEFMNGETCFQNYVDSGSTDGTTNTVTTSVPLNPSCIDPSSGIDYCYEDSTDPNCQQKIPNVVTCAQDAYESQSVLYPNPSSLNNWSYALSSIMLNPSCPTDCVSNPTDPDCQLPVSNAYSFQLNDSCTDSDLGGKYNPSCDPCCQPMVVNGKSVRPTSCYPYTANYPTSCYNTPTGTGCSCTSSSSPSDPVCGVPTTPSGECTTNNPYGSSYPFLYDASYQEYANGMSFLDKFGRDQQMAGNPLLSEPSANVAAPAIAVPPTIMNVLGQFPNGIYPFFWLMKDYSPEVDNLNPTTTPLTASQLLWCTSSVASGYTPSTATATAFPDLNQLTLSYNCSGQNCCVNYLMNSLPGAVTATGTQNNTLTVTVGTVPTVQLSATPTSNIIAGPSTSIAVSATATENNPGSIAGLSFYINGGQVDVNNLTTTPSSLPANTVTFSANLLVPTCSNATGTPKSTATGSYTLTAIATDTENPPNQGTSNAVTINVTNPDTCPTVSPPTTYTYGTDGCGVDCPNFQACSGTGQIKNPVTTGSTAGTCSCTSNDTCPASNGCGVNCFGSTCGTGSCTSPATCHDLGGTGTAGTCS